MEQPKKNSHLSTRQLLALVGLGGILVSCLIVFLFIAIVCGAVLARNHARGSAMYPLGKSRPTDQEMISQFYEHRSELGELARMIQDDQPLEYVGMDDYRGSYLTDGRLAKYRLLLDAAGCNHVGQHEMAGKKIIEVGIWAGGGPIDDGPYLDFVLLPDGMPEDYCYHLVPSMNGLDLSNRPWERCCRHVEGNWYLTLIY